MINLSLEDLKPSESTFALSAKPGRLYTLKKFSLAERIWINQRFGKENVQRIFESQSLPEMCEIAHRLLKNPKDREEFPTFESFAAEIFTVQDSISLTKALLATVGIDDALLKKLSAEMDEQDRPNGETPAQK